jgi:prolyl-tRNA synthetase
MKFSKSFIHTLKEIPSDVDVENISQILMARAGLVKRMSNGLYVKMPTMLAVMERVKQEIRRGMASVDCSEVDFPVLVMKNDLEESGRWNAFGNEIFKLKDRNEKDVALAPTSEEAACFMARTYISSHNQLPLALFQMQKKYRDEIRPKGGVLRAREFTMKDAYSFHADAACLDAYYEKQKQAYYSIFNNLGLKVVHVAADSGAMGGDKCDEFMAFSQNGEDIVAVCECGHSANIETLGFGKDTALDTKIKCPKCKKVATLKRACEIGHIFALGTHYSKKLGLNYTDKNGEKKLIYMGCYGIGVERIVAMIVEQHNDMNGIKWPENVAPFRYNIITVNMDDREAVLTSEKIYREYLEKGESVLWDERSVSAGVKFKDSDLLGIPNKIVIGKKGVSHEKR